MHKNSHQKFGQTQRLRAFTLAEVLITLGIIGVVAAITIPTLMAGSRKSTVETRLKGFYSNINQAIKLSEIENGDKKTWDALSSTTASDVQIWYDKYLGPYLKTSSVDSTTFSNRIIVYLLDGSAFAFYQNSWAYFPEAKDVQPFILADKSKCGIKYFLFLFNPASTNPTMTYHYDKGVEPYKYAWDGSESKLLNDTAYGCQQTVSGERAYCTALIQTNGWKIPDNYPFNF